ncbi:MAG: metallophosphoesterase [Myxococcales bacterium]|nr:metallophosphoesterase [Myxococcales bacterium]MCB9756130.1 metallophosphoesterase [Myxococcales bacterium]
MGVPSRDLLLISDLHLGSHLKPRLRGEYVHLAARIDESLPRFLDHYIAEGGPWQLIVNGDFIDFWNIELVPGVDRARSKKIRGAELAVHRLHAALDAYPGVEDALIRFLSAGHGIVFVAGNHDAELLYPEVRRALANRLEEGVEREEPLDPEAVTRTGTTRLDDLEPGRVRFVPWFLLEEGGAWIEHGHNFDAACATQASLSPTRQGRLVQSIAEVATRGFTNLVPEIDYDAPDRYSAMDYLRWAGARGFRFMIYVVLLYLRMIGRMMALWVRTGRVDKAGRTEHQERLERVAQNAGLQMSALTAIEAMAPPPSSATVGGVLSVTALDLVLTLASVTAVVAGIARLLTAPMWLALPLGLLAGFFAMRGVGRRRKKRDVHEDMTRIAAEVGQVTGVPMVLMGHSHRGELVECEGVVYGNSGCWLDGSHLVVRREDGTRRLAEAELRVWRNGGVSVVRRVSVPRGQTAPLGAGADAGAGEGGAKLPVAAADAA